MSNILMFLPWTETGVLEIVYAKIFRARPTLSKEVSQNGKLGEGFDLH